MFFPSPAKDSICKACKTKGHWANSLVCPNDFKTGARGSTEETKLDAHPAQSRFPGNPSLQFISADAKSQISPTASVKTINLSAIPSVGSHCYAAFVVGNFNWIQRCMVDPGANINCVASDWITCFETPEWNYALECGSVKAAGGHSLDVEARVLLKISWPPEDPILSVNQWFHIVHGEDGVVLGSHLPCSGCY